MLILNGRTRLASLPILLMSRGAGGKNRKGTCTKQDETTNEWYPGSCGPAGLLCRMTAGSLYLSGMGNRVSQGAELSLRKNVRGRVLLFE